MKMLPVLFLGIVLLVGCGDPDLDDPKAVDKIIENALPQENVRERGPKGEQLIYAPNTQVPYSGWVREMHDNGQVKALKHYKDGKGDGLWTRWHENGQKETEGHHKDGKRDGLWTGWHENGQKESETHFKDGKQDGLWTGWHENGQKKFEGHFKDGKFDGLQTSWHENGQKKSETRYKDGKIDGLETGWHENGQKESETHFKDGKQDGLWTGWHENGQKEQEVRYKDGKGDGLHTLWNENGQKRWEIHYKDGKKDGLSTEWDEDGKVVDKVRWIDGVEVKRGYLELLGSAGGDDSAAIIRSALADEDKNTQLAAIGALRSWPDDTMFEALIDFATGQEDDLLRSQSFNAAFTFLKLDRERDVDDLEDMWKMLAGEARTPKEKRQVIDGMAKLTDEWAFSVVEFFEEDDDDDVSFRAERAREHMDTRRQRIKGDDEDD